MRFFKVAVGFLCLWLAAFATSAADYYQTAQGKSGLQLRQALHSLLTNHTVVPYTHATRVDVWEALQILDEDPNNTNNVILIYAQRSEPKAYTNITWNREHLWPRSYGLGDDESKAEHNDLYNLRAEDATVNSARGNEYYDNGGTRPAHSEAPQCASDADSWESQCALAVFLDHGRALAPCLDGASVLSPPLRQRRPQRHD